jgi:hypothetical protein
MKNLIRRAVTAASNAALDQDTRRIWFCIEER